MFFKDFDDSPSEKKADSKVIEQEDESYTNILKSNVQQSTSVKEKDENDE